jgi:hypothetical protein
MFTAPLELLIELPQADDVHGEAQDVMHPLERLVLSVLALEEDGVAPLDADHLAVAKLHHVVDAVVELGEGRAHSGHVIGGDRVKDPCGGPPLTPVAQLDKQLHSHRGGSERAAAAMWRAPGRKKKVVLTLAVATISMSSSSSSWARWASSSS